MKFIFLFGLFPEVYREEIEKNSKGNIQYAANALQWNIVKGFDLLDSIKLINLPYVGSYPLAYRKLSTPTFKFEHKSGANDINIGFFNFMYVNRYFRYLAARRQLLKTFNKLENDNTTIIIYSLNSSFLKAAVDAKSKFKNIKLCVVAPDLPEYMSDKNSCLETILWKLESFLVRKYVAEVDSFVFLTDYMAEALNVTDKPNIIIEGIFDPLICVKSKKKKQEKTILYTGTLERRYGILNLLTAFSKITDPDYRLWICGGGGDTNSEIVEFANKDKRIMHLGLRPHKEILELQQCATVLVNPRTSESKFTKYSFPSKTMEYLVSGTPCILYKLEGIPPEYFAYCFVVEEETIDCLKNKIVEVCELGEEHRNKFGLAAKKFILEKKNPKAQCEKIINMLNKN